MSGNGAPIRPGDRFGRWVVVGEAVLRPCGGVRRSFYLCRCDCGTEREVLGRHLKQGDSRSCGCRVPELARERGLASAPELPVGATFGLWMVIGPRVLVAYADGGRHSRYPCRCACGTERLVTAHHLTRGHSRSCGCRCQTCSGTGFVCTAEGGDVCWVCGGTGRAPHSPAPGVASERK